MLSADEIIRRQEKLQGDRSNWEQQWSDIARLCLPRQDDFVRKAVNGENRDKTVYDSTAPLALERFSAAIESMLTPRTQKWHRLRISDDSLNKNIRVKRYMDQATDVLFRIRYGIKSNFASQASEVYMSLGSFGTGVMFVDDGLEQGIRYRNIHLSEVYIAENHLGMVDRLYRKYQYTVTQAIQAFGDECPTKIKELKDTEPGRPFWFIHAVCPNEDKIRSRTDYKGMAFHAYDVCVDTKEMIRKGGYRVFPYAASRYVTGPREVYGRSPAMTCLADIKTLNEMSKTILRYAQLSTDPPWLLPDLDTIQAFATRPGSLNYGGVNEAGQRLVHSMAPDANPQITLELMNQRRESINRAFLVTLFQILVDSPEMTATEVMQRAQEKGALLAPTIGRQQSEFLGPMIERELDILALAGALPEPPPELLEAGTEVTIEYDSPLTRVQRAEEGTAILRTIEALGPLTALNPRVKNRLNADEAFIRLAEINGAPAAILYSDDEMEAASEQDAQAEQMAQMLQAAPLAAGAAKDMATAQKIAGGATT